MKPKGLFNRVYKVLGAALCLGYGIPGLPAWAIDPTPTPTPVYVIATPSAPVSIAYVPLAPMTLSSPWTAASGTVSLPTALISPVSYTIVPAWMPGNPAAPVSNAAAVVLVAPVSITYVPFTPMTLTSPWTATPAAPAGPANASTGPLTYAH